MEQSLSNAGMLAGVLLISSIIAAFLLLFVIRTIRKPLTELEHATQELASGNLDYPLDGSSGDEIGRLVAFVMSDDCDYMTGSTLLMDGGISLPWWSNRAEGKQ